MQLDAVMIFEQRVWVKRSDVSRFAAISPLVIVYKKTPELLISGNRCIWLMGKKNWTPKKSNFKFLDSAHPTKDNPQLLGQHLSGTLGWPVWMYEPELVPGGCLGYPGASTVASQPLDRILLPWLANPCNPTMSPHSRHPATLNESVEGKKEGGWGGGTWTTIASNPFISRLLKKNQLLEETPNVLRLEKTSNASCSKTQLLLGTQT